MAAGERPLRLGSLRPIGLVAVAVAATWLAVVAIAMLERPRAALEVETVWLAGSPVTLWRPSAGEAAPLVVVAHGYAGSRQMMQALAITLARAGFVVAAFDFHGHGRHREPMVADVTSLEGATAQLVRQTAAVTAAARVRTGATGPVALVGHSMATDIVIRAAAEIEGVAAVVAISMYSDAVAPDFPERLLIVSGAREGRLRQVALDRLRQVDPAAEEGETVRGDGVARRAAAAPWVGHVGVLYSPVTLAETRDWIAAAMPPIERPAEGALPTTGLWLAVLLLALVALAWPLAAFLGVPHPADGCDRRTALLALAAPVGPALAAAVLTPEGALGLSAFGPLTAFFGVWGLVQLTVLWRSGLWRSDLWRCDLWRAGLRPGRFRAGGFALLLVWGLGLFALALDRYGAAFLPLGPRWPVMGLLLTGTVPFLVADAVLVRGAGVALRLAARVLPLATLLGAMVLAPRLGIAFTVLPVMVLFWLVYGLAGRWVARRVGPLAPGLALGVILAWAIAASTPLIAA